MIAVGEWFRLAPEIRAAIELCRALHFEDVRPPLHRAALTAGARA